MAKQFDHARQVDILQKTNELLRYNGILKDVQIKQQQARIDELEMLLGEARRNVTLSQAAHASTLATIDQFVSNAQRNNERIRDGYDTVMTELLNANEQTEQPHLSQALALLATNVNDVLAEKFNRLLDTHRANPTTATSLLLAKYLIEMSTNQDRAILELTMALGYSNDPPSVCDSIERMLRVSGKINPAYISRIWQWLEKQDAAPDKQSTAIRWLEHTAAQQSSGLSIKEYCAQNGIIDRSFRDMSAFRELIASTQKLLPDKLRLMKRPDQRE